MMTVFYFIYSALLVSFDNPHVYIAISIQIIFLLSAALVFVLLSYKYSTDLIKALAKFY